MECVLNLFDPAFDQGHTMKYRLSILFQQDGFSFCIVDNRTRKYLAVYEARNLTPVVAGSDKLCGLVKKHLESIGISRLPFGGVDIAYFSPKVTLIPAGFIQSLSIDDYFKFNHSLDISEVVLRQEIPVAEVSAVFSLPACLKTLALDWFQATKVGCSANILIQSLLRANAHILARQVFINLWAGHFDIIILQGRKLLYYNTFKKLVPEDLVYYVLFVLEQLGFIPAEEELTLLGEIDEDSSDYKLLYQYINSLQFGSAMPYAEFSPIFREVLVHKHYTLFNLPFCE